MKLLITIMLIFFCLINLYGKEKEKKNSKKWSDYQGLMNWNNGKAKCASIGMRLPTIEELKAAYTAKVTEPWKADGHGYWSSTPNGDSLAYGLGFNGYGYLRDYDNLVRCIR
jgi:hypothetical protein